MARARDSWTATSRHVFGDTHSPPPHPSLPTAHYHVFDTTMNANRVMEPGPMRRRRTGRQEQLTGVFPPRGDSLAGTRHPQYPSPGSTRCSVGHSLSPSSLPEYMDNLVLLFVQ
ncbi:hypothetical protein J6590_021128 [Homalodisca vitripennis]|nr:hypothetical protein J6590_021128 [Homalodisca vitripennis]